MFSLSLSCSELARRSFRWHSEGHCSLSWRQPW